MFHIRDLSSSSIKSHVNWNSFEQRYFLHTCLPLMNKETSSDKKDSSKSDESIGQPHMRIEAKAAATEIRMYKEEQM